MTPDRLSRKVVTERSDWVTEMLERIKALPLESLEDFGSDQRNVDAAESCLRRALEALLDLGRHTLAKGFGGAPPESHHGGAGTGTCPDAGSRRGAVPGEGRRRQRHIRKETRLRPPRPPAGHAAPQ